jgi:hypothetical protein
MIDARVLFARGKAVLESAGPTIDSVPAMLVRGLARSAVPLTWMSLGFASVGAIAMTAAYLPLHSGRAAVAPQPRTSETAASQTRASDFAGRWHDEWVQVAGRVGAPVPRKRDDSWLWTTMPSPYATRFTRNDAAMTVATPLPLPRPDAMARPAVAAAAAPAPAVSEPRVASLPPQPDSQAQPSEPGLLDKLFGDPDRAAKAVLAAHPNTVLYDITKRAVYMPDGTKLEAHSGFGEWLDDPDSMHRKNVGVTPPNVYAVSFREKPFHGVRALRMKPVGDGKMYGRDGILAHSFLLGEAGASNGCISIREYDAFLKAFEDGQFNRIIVVRSIDEPMPRVVASAQ